MGSTGASPSSSSFASAPTAASDWLVWQMVDSLYPTGGFAHSQGLEAAVQENHVSNAQPDSLRHFLSATLHQTANFALPIVYTAHVSATMPADDGRTFVDSFLEINAKASALYSNHVARKASFAQGAAMLRLAISTYNQKQGDCFDQLLTIRKESKKRNHAGIHHAVIFGAVCALLGIEAATCQRMYLFFVIRDVLSAATRLNLIGPFEATRMQYDIGPLMESVCKRKQNRPIHDSYSSAPVLDLIQAMHDQLYTRIFNS